MFIKKRVSIIILDRGGDDNPLNCKMQRLCQHPKGIHIEEKTSFVRQEKSNLKILENSLHLMETDRI